MPDHLDRVTTSRGFDHMPMLTNERGVSVRVYESSNAEGPHLWLALALGEDSFGGTTAIQLEATQAWQLAEQLSYLVANHYQGDARPPVAERATDLTTSDSGGESDVQSQ